MELIIPCSEKGMEHVGFKWSPSTSIPVGKVWPLLIEVTRELAEHKQVLIGLQDTLKKTRTTAVFLPDIQNEVAAFQVKALSEYGSQEERLNALLAALRGICQHRGAFPLDNPASARENIDCPDCRKMVLSGQVFESNSRGSVAQVQWAWSELTKKRIDDVAVAGQRKKRLEEAKARLDDTLSTQADAGILATLKSSINTELGVISETLAATKRRRGEYELSVEAFVGAMLILKQVAEARVHQRLSDKDIKELVGEFAVTNSPFAQFAKAVVDQIDIWN
jgi:hypothetical protein